MLNDVIVVGAGPAGLSAALILGRCRRRVLVFDTRTPRNAASRALHGFITRDGMPPNEFLGLAREELAKYDTVQLHDVEVTEAQCGSDGIYTVVVAGGERYQAKKLLLATGVCDNLPDIPGFRDFYGTSVFHCPYCDGWEVRDRPLAIYGRGARGFGLALELTAWSRDLVLCTDGPSELEAEELDRLRRNGITVRRGARHGARGSRQAADTGRVRRRRRHRSARAVLHHRPVPALGPARASWLRVQR